MQRLQDAVSTDEMVKILLEGGYPAGSDYNEILSEAEREAEAFFKETAVSGYGLECFSVLSDYHNAKVAAKELFFGAVGSGYKADGTVPSSELAEKIKKEDFSSLPSEMLIALESLKKKNASALLLPSEIDKSLDRAAFSEIGKMLTKAHPVVRNYFETYVDLTNLSVAYRARIAGLTEKEMESGLLPGGLLTRKEIGCLFDLDLSDAAEKLSLKETYKQALEKLKEGVAPYEAFVENALLAPLKKARYDLFSPAPILGFYLGKKREIKNVRLLFAGVKNGVDKEILKVRLREQYV